MAKSIKHFGVMGMHWGQRKASSASPEHLAVKTLKKKKVSDMTNAELKAVTTRLQLEKSFKEITATQVSPGKKMVNDMISNFGKQALTSFLSKYATPDNFRAAVNFATKAAREAKKHRGAGYSVVTALALPAPQ